MEETICAFNVVSEPAHIRGCCSGGRVKTSIDTQEIAVVARTERGSFCDADRHGLVIIRPQQKVRCLAKVGGQLRGVGHRR
jgi:hypothetical protein